MLPIEWRASADADLFEILDFISERNKQAAERLYGLIEDALKHASEHPYLYKSSQRMPGMREIVAHPNYIVLYGVTATCIEVVNVVHARRQFPSVADDF